MFIPNMDTRYFVLYGKPLRHSVSPWMHNNVFNRLGLNNFYYPLEFENEKTLAKSIDNMAMNRVFGANITMPYKTMVAQYLDALADSALRTGVVNTIVVSEEGRKVGHNTDGIGFVSALTNILKIKSSEKTFLILGAGGAATAIVFALAECGVRKIKVLCRHEDRHLTETLQRGMDQYYPDVCRTADLCEKNLKKGLLKADVVIHATKVGMYPDTNEIILDPTLLNERHIVCDVVYNPTETKLLTEAAKRGCKVIGGLWMMVFQGAEACRLWTGIAPPVDFMYEKVCEFFQTKIKLMRI